MTKEERCLHECRYCKHHIDSYSETRVYFGVVGPFCNVQCRELYLLADSYKQEPAK